MLCLRYRSAEVIHVFIDSMIIRTFLFEISPCKFNYKIKSIKNIFEYICMTWNEYISSKTENRIQQFDHDRQFDTIVSGRTVPKIGDMRLGQAKEFELVVMHIDMNGFKKLTGNLSNEQKLRFLNIYHSEIAAMIRDYDGFIEKYVGDGITALFGIDVNKNIAVMNATICGLAILTDIKYVMNKYLKTIHLPCFTCSVGLDYGKIWVARTGIKGMNQLTLVGNEVSISKQLEEFAGNNQLFLGHSAYLGLDSKQQSFCNQQKNRDDFLWVFDDNIDKMYTFYHYNACWPGYNL